MLKYAVRLTSETCAINEDDLSSLRKVGFNDKAILDIVQVVSYFNFVTRLACGLGIELEDYNKHGE